MKSLMSLILLGTMFNSFASDVKIAKLFDGGARYCQSKSDLSRADEISYKIYSPKIERSEDIVNVNFLLSAVKCNMQEDGSVAFENVRVDQASSISYNGVDTVLITRNNFKIRAYTDEGAVLFEKEIFAIKATEEVIDMDLANDTIARTTVNNGNTQYNSYVNVDIVFSEKRELGDYSSEREVTASAFRVLMK